MRGSQPSTGTAILLVAAFDIAGHSAGDAADDRTGPGVAARDGSNTGPPSGADCSTTHRSLLPWRHVRASDHDRHSPNHRNPAKSFHDRSPLRVLFQTGHDHFKPDGLDYRMLDF